MRTYLMFFSIFLVCLLQLESFAQEWECEECPRRSIGLFDCDVQVLQPSWGDSLSLNDWLEFNFIAGGIHEEMIYNDPSRDCLSFYDGQFVLQAENMPDFDSMSYQINYNWQNLPEPGPVSYVDYIIYAELSQSGTDYFLTVYLEAGKTRELAAVNTIQYNLSLSGVQNGKNALQSLMPLMEKIREFEKQKRNEMPNVAIDANLEVKSEKSYLNTNESTQIRLLLKDCDDFKLHNREIHLTTSSGSLSSYSVNTDQDGEAQVIFTAGNSPAWVEIYAEHSFYYPQGTGTFGAADEKFISVQKSPVDVWDFKVTANARVLKYADTSWTINIPNQGSITDYRTLYSGYSSKLTLAGLIPNECGGYGNDFCYSGNEPPILWFAYGDAGEFSKEKLTEYLNGEFEIFGQIVTLCNSLAVGSEIRTDNYNIRTDNAGLYVEYSDGYKYFDISGYGDGEAVYHSQEWTSEEVWENYEGTYPRSADITVSWDDSRPGGSLIFQDSIYTLSYNNTETTYEASVEYGTIITTISKSLNGIIKPFYRTITDICDDHPKILTIPENYDLRCYPNPFNPSTKVLYSIPENESQMSKVRLIVYDILGNLAATLVDEYKPAGRYEIEFNPASIKKTSASGIYFCRLLTDGNSKTIKMVYIK